MDEPRAVVRARADIEAGELWRARDRLQSYVSQNAWDQQALALLADVYLRMGDRPAAGRFLYVVDRDDAESRRAREAFERPLRGRHLLRAIPAREPFDRYPEAVRRRLEAAATRAGAEGTADRHGEEEEDAGWDVRGFAGCLLVAALTLGVWVFGWVALIALLVREL